MLFVLIRGTRRSVQCPRQSRREGTAAGTRRSVRCPRQSRREGTAARTPTHSAISPPPPTHPPACLSAGGLTRGSGQVHKVVMESGASLHVQHHFDKSTRHPTKYRRRQQILLKQLVYSADAVSVAVQSSSSHKDNVRSTAAEEQLKQKKSSFLGPVPPPSS